MLRSRSFNVHRTSIVAFHLSEYTTKYNVADMNAPTPPPPQWVLDLNTPPTPKQKNSGIPDPPGYTSTAITSKVSSHSPRSLYHSNRSPETNCLLLQNHNTSRPHNRPNGRSQAQKSLGSSPSTRKATTNDRNNDVHVGQLVTNIQYHDGSNGI